MEASETQKVEPRTKFEIPLEHLGELNSKLLKLNRKAVKLGLPQIETRVLSSFQKRVIIPQKLSITEDWRFFDPETDTILVHFLEIEILGISPQLPGWEFFGTLQHTEAGNILRSFPGKEIPETFRNVTPICDHCKKKRARKDTYVVRHESGEFKQIGHQCIRDFLGHQSPEQLGQAAEFLKFLEDNSNPDFESMGGGGGKLSVPVEVFLNMIAELTIRHGFHSARHPKSTYHEAWKQLFPRRDDWKHWREHPEDRVEEISDAAKKLAADSLQHLKTFKPHGSFEANLQVLSCLPYVTHREASMLSWAIPTFEKAQDPRNQTPRVPTNLPEDLHKWLMAQPDTNEFIQAMKGKTSFSSNMIAALERMRSAEAQREAVKSGAHIPVPKKPGVTKIIYSFGQPYGAPMAMLRGAGCTDAKEWLKYKYAFNWSDHGFCWESVMDREELLDVLVELEKFGFKVVAKKDLKDHYLIRGFPRDS